MFYQCNKCSPSQPCYFYDPKDLVRPLSCPAQDYPDAEWEAKKGVITIDYTEDKDKDKDKTNDSI